MKILLTGGSGYIGTILTQKLLKLGHEVVVVDLFWFGNVLKPHERLEVIELNTLDTDKIPMEGIDAIVHLANIANDPCGDLDPKLSWEVNALATMRLADKALRHGVKQILFASSGSVYGIKEEPQVTEELELKPITEYNKTKMVAERVLLSYRDDMIIQCIRPATVCGYSPQMRLDVSVNLLTMQALMNGVITVFGGVQTRPNIHIQDITDVFLHFLNLGEKATGIYNAGFENMSIMEIARKIAEKIPAEIKVTESNDPRSYRLNSDKLINTGYQQKNSVDDAINEIIEAYNSKELTNQDNFYRVKWMKQMLSK